MKTRFCPSPTGFMHLGNARTALFNALAANADQGIFLLRIEDTDQSRSGENYTEQLMDDMKWLGMPWHEGPEADGGAGPYWQSRRADIYNAYYEQLEKAGQAYPCFCSEEQLALNRKIQRASGQPPRYPGTCRSLAPQEVEAKLAEGQTPTLRFRVPDAEMIEFEDSVRGVQRFNSDDIGDFIIRRADKTASFMFCNAVDDALMQVSHAMRGEDHLTNSPRQIMILKALGLTAPTYAHISLILGSDGAPLSKRNGSRSIKDLREEGYLPAAVTNYLARLGHYYEHDEFCSMEKLAQDFKFKHLNKSPARFDEEQLKRWQKLAVQALSPSECWEWLQPHLSDRVATSMAGDFIATIQANIVFPKDAMLWAEAFFAPHLDHSHDGKVVLKSAGVVFFEAALEALNEVGPDFKALTTIVKEKCAVKGKALFMPLRVALTGEQFGPEMANVLKLMGVERARQRFEAALFSI